MNKLGILITAYLSFSCFVYGQILKDLHPALLPDPMKIKEGVAVFVDFQHAQYHLNFDSKSKKATYKALIQFKSPYNGFPIFDVVRNPKMIKINGAVVTSRPVVTPSQETTIRILNKAITAGSYEMEIEGEFTEDFSIEKDGTFKAAFWYNDQEDRSFIEKYLPTNLEYDQYSIRIIINQIGFQSEHQIYTNGVLKKRHDVQKTIVTEIDFPNYFNSSSIFLHILDKANITEIKETYTSRKSAKIIPITIYSLMASNQILSEAMKSTINVLKQLENEVGPYPYDSLLVYLIPDEQGGLEYISAVVSEMKNLRHEIFHQYLSRGYMPANGNAGWIDEAITTWFDRNKPVKTILESSYNLANQATYTRFTDSKAYSHGVDFISYLHQYLISQKRGGLMRFMQFVARNKIHEVYTTELFIQEMEKFYHLPLDSMFKKYVY